jgi:hypothetical protein
MQNGSHFVRDDICQRGLPKSGRPGEQHVVESFSAVEGRFHIDPQVLFHLPLADIVLKPARANGQFKLLFVVA